MSVLEIYGGNDRRSMIKRYERKSKADAVRELVDLMHCNWRQVEILERERDAALAELAALKGGQDELQAQKELMEQALSDLWSVRIDKIKSHCMDAAPPAQASAWVAVSERLPAETYAYGCHTDDVLCRTRSGKLIIAMLAQTTTGPVWYDQQSQERDVTHWQPLPAAPTPGASDGKGGDV